MRHRPLRPLLAVALTVAGALALLAFSRDEAAPDVDPVAALAEGNRLFRGERLEEAIDAYRQGWDPAAPHPTLVYNLATTLHRLERLPEAILWYRRAAEISRDPWLEDNLWLARRTLGSQTLPPGGVDGLLARWGGTLRIAAVVCAWAVALLVVAARAPRWLPVALAVLAFALYGMAAAGERWAARPAVVMRDCSTEAGDLPAGTEAWVRPLADGRWRIAARSTDAICPPEAVALVEAGR